MQTLSLEELKRLLKERKPGGLLSLPRCRVQDGNFAGWKLDHVDFTLSRFENCCFDGADFSFSILENVLFTSCSFHNANFRNACLRTADFRHDDMTDAHIEGADLFGAVLEYAKLDGITYDKNTKFFEMYCPKEGAFLGYKKCFNNRLVQLLIPADAKRTSATLNSCRCSKAKVLTIKSFDYTEEFEEAWSLVDENFVYRKGQWVEVPDFNEDRWQDSTTGIHFWMTREEALAY